MEGEGELCMRLCVWSKDAYKALPHPPLGKSEYNYILLIPAYKQKLKKEVPVPIRKLSGEADAKLQDCFASTDWNIFQDSSDGIEEFTTWVTSIINKCMDDIVPTYLNEKKWITGQIRTELIARAAAFKK